MPQETQTELDKPAHAPQYDVTPPPDALYAALGRIMQTDADSNMVFGNIPKGEAEDRAAALTFAMHTGSRVIIDYENLVNMGKRAEKGSLLKDILQTIRAIGKAPQQKPSFFDRFRQW